MAFSKFLDSKNNLASRRIFGTEKNKDILIYLPHDILGWTGKAKIEYVSLLSSIQNPDITTKKESIVDVSLEILQVCNSFAGRTGR